MGVVRIDDKLLRQLKEFLKREDNKYKYGSLANYINSIIYYNLKLQSKRDKEE